MRHSHRRRPGGRHMIPATKGATVALAALLAISRQGLAGLEGAATAAVVRRRGNRVPRDGALGERQEAGARAGVGRLVEPDVGPRRRRVRQPKPASARPTGLLRILGPPRDDRQSEGPRVARRRVQPAREVAPAGPARSRRGAERRRRSRFPTFGGSP